MRKADQTQLKKDLEKEIETLDLQIDQDNWGIGCGTRT